ncbi:F-BAR and double SH3 domains protein 2-like isoform X2 [Littorina saxatilis]|uniref:F-BAR and double SH3 domains protein 2-like isoform X2 n=1 Tax=Littorina saxatilis TaxID=31220 RepID=UPI0038B5C532
MNPPPRKVKPAVALKHIHAEQVSKLQAKHQQECDILEDIRTYYRQKATLEKEYAQGLLKVTTQLLKRDFPAQPDIASDDGLEHKTVVTVWRHLLEESDRQAKCRLAASEIYAERIAEPLKGVKSAKQQTTKKVMPQLGVIHGEVGTTVLDMVKAQKAYYVEEAAAHDARQKVAEAEDKIKRKSTGLFQSMSGLQKTCAKLHSRMEASDIKSTAARNDYLLTMAAANAHQIRFYSTDLPELMKTLDCDIYDRIHEYLLLANTTAADIAKVEANTFATIADESEKISRQFSLQCYLFQNQVFTNLVQYHFDPCQNDPCNKVSGEHGAAPELEKEARKCATKVAKETKLVRDYYRQLTQLQAKVTDRMSESSQEEKLDAKEGKTNGAAVDPEVRMEEVRQNIRKAETSKMKAEARLEALRQAGINVDEWLDQAQMDSLTADENGIQRTPSQMSLRTESSGGHSADDPEPTYTHYDDDDDDFNDDTFTSNYGGSMNRFGKPFPILCKALYDFEASNYDELSIKQHEPLTLVAIGDGEGWVKAQSSSGKAGYIPENYVDLSETDMSMQTSDATPEVHTINASNVDTDVTPTVEAAPLSPPPPSSPPAEQQPPPQLEQQQQQPQQQSQPAAVPTMAELQSPPTEMPPDTTSSYSSGDLEVQQATDDFVEDSAFPPPPPSTSVPGATWARALYDYGAQTNEELSFMEGALIKIVRKDDNGVDDGYWEGELNGRSGVFPSLVVEEIMDPNADPDALSPLTDFGVPPPVLVTMPTPDDEPPPPPPLCQNGAVHRPRKARNSGGFVRIGSVNPESYESAV